jgi:hypothetical protein
MPYAGAIGLSTDLQDRTKLFVKFLLLASAGERNCAIVVQHDKSIMQLQYPIGGSASP